MRPNEYEKQIYRKVKHFYDVETAKEQVANFLEDWPRHSDIDFDEEKLATIFDENYTMEVAENDQWANIILQYVSTHKTKKRSIDITAYPNMRQDGTLYIPASLTAQDDIARYVKDHWDEISWGDMEDIDGDIEFRVATPDGDFIYDSYS